MAYVRVILQPGGTTKEFLPFQSDRKHGLIKRQDLCVRILVASCARRRLALLRVPALLVVRLLLMLRLEDRVLRLAGVLVIKDGGLLLAGRAAGAPVEVAVEAAASEAEADAGCWNVM